MSNKKCPNCGRIMKHQFNDLMHCRCGVSWAPHMGFFRRTSDMTFCLQRKKVGRKTKNLSVIKHKKDVSEN